jgi:1,2-diacylglycerol 3-alpha-glucosyltransferase
MNIENKLLKVFLVCSGLGNIRRGYESFTQECFTALSNVSSLEVTLLQGGDSPIHDAHTLWNLPRNHPITKQLATLAKKSSSFNEPYFIEQTSFFFSLLPRVYREKPDVIFYSDFALGTMLWHWRRISKLSYKLLFSNGAPNGPPFSRMDHVQHLTPTHYQIALDAGEPVENHSLIPYGIKVSQDWNPLVQSEREVLRRTLNLPSNCSLILSVGTINKTHKRMDYVIREIARLPEPRPCLVILGQMDTESAEVIRLGNQLLGTENFLIRTVSYTEIGNYYNAADLFVLASLSEGFGRVFLEAMAYGLPCLTHEYEVARFVLSGEGYFANFELSGSLANLIVQASTQNSENGRCLRHRSVYNRFSWEQLQPAYVDMILHCVHPCLTAYSG